MAPTWCQHAGYFLNHPNVDAEHPFALDYQTIVTAQDQDPELQQKLATKPHQYARTAMSNDVNVIGYIPEPNTPWRICLPTAMLHNTVRWYHLSLNHIGMTRTYDTMAIHLYHPKLKNVCEDILRSCDSCQRFKLSGRGYGEMPARNPQVALYHMCMT
jgi:hypothetical protein